MALFAEGKLFREAGTGSGGGDKHNKGYFVDESALTTAYPTAEAGDYAIVESTDTVWVWDSDNQEWVDSDQKGQVTSVNGQTGDVTVSAVPSMEGYSGRVLGTDGTVAGWVVPENVQRSTMPQADENEVNNIYQFTGTTDANYTNGYFYKCVSDGQDPATYSWTQVDVQPSELPSQSGNSGKFLTTDGTDASWATINALQNTATGTNSLTINGNAASVQNAVNIGSQSSVSALAVAVGKYASAGQNSVRIGGASNSYSSDQGNNNVLIGYTAGSNWGVSYGVAIGSGVGIGANGAIQIGHNGSSGAPANTFNNDANTFKVANANGNFEMMSADGTVPTARLTKVNTTATLAVADWSSNTQTVTVSGVKADSVVFVSPAPASASDYASAGILCTAQAADSLTFTCTTTPTSAITVNVVCM